MFLYPIAKARGRVDASPRGGKLSKIFQEQWQKTIHTISSGLLGPKMSQIEIKEANSKAICGKLANYHETLHRRVWCRVLSTTSKEQDGESVICIKVRSVKNKPPSSKLSSSWDIQIWWEACLKVLTKWPTLLYKLIRKLMFFWGADYISDAMLSASNNKINNYC